MQFSESEQTNQIMKLKIVWNNDIRIFNTDSDNWNEILPSIRTFVDESFGLQDFNVTYIDDEDVGFVHLYYSFFS